VTPAGYDGSYILSPLVPASVDKTTTLKEVDPGGFFQGIQRGASRDTYTVTADIPISDGTSQGGIESNRLIEAGKDYPQEIKDLYLGIPDGAMGPDANKLLAQMLAAVPGGLPSTPYQIAKSLETQFHDGSVFKYQTDVLSLPCAEQRLSTVECFATFKTGYCQYYASTFAIFLRTQGIPTRLVEGYLPGDRDERTGVETLLAKDRHEWVEVYFPGYGWVPFDPTGGGVSKLPVLASGAPPANATPKPSSSVGPGSSSLATRDPRDEGPSGAGTVTSGKGPGAGLFGAIAILLIVVVGAAAFMVWRREPRGGTSPDRAYGTVTRLASRLGFGPRPNQTVYEYAGALADVLPESRPALETVARAKVESTYGRTLIESDRLQALREAERRLRVSLLRLVFRRGRRTF
jgi:hypothetical protein